MGNNGDDHDNYCCEQSREGIDLAGLCHGGGEKENRKEERDMMDVGILVCGMWRTWIWKLFGEDLAVGVVDIIVRRKTKLNN